jgi:hypothetical protein
VASALAGAVVVALGYASGLGVPLRNDATASLEQPAPPPAATTPPPAATPPMAMSMAPSYAGTAGGMTGMTGMAGMDRGAAAGADTPPDEPMPTPEAPGPAPAPKRPCRDIVAALPTADLPLVGPLAGSLTGAVSTTLGGLLGTAPVASDVAASLGPLTAPVTDLLTTPLAGGEQSPPPCLPGQPTTARETTR